MNPFDFAPKCQSCDIICSLYKAYEISNENVNWFVCGEMCVDNMLESLVDFGWPQKDIDMLEVGKVYWSDEDGKELMGFLGIE